MVITMDKNNNFKNIGKKLNELGYLFNIEDFENTALGQRLNAKMGPDFESGPCFLIYKKQKNTLVDYNVFESTTVIKDGCFINKPEWFIDKLVEVVKPLLNNEQE